MYLKWYLSHQGVHNQAFSLSSFISLYWPCKIIVNLIFIRSDFIMNMWYSELYYILLSKSKCAPKTKKERHYQKLKTKPIWHFKFSSIISNPFKMSRMSLMLLWFQFETWIGQFQHYNKCAITVLPCKIDVCLLFMQITLPYFRSKLGLLYVFV